MKRHPSLTSFSTQLLPKVHSFCHILKGFPWLSDISFSDLDVYSALTTLDLSKAMGIDGIGPRILNHCALALYQPIHHLFSLSLSQHYLPEEWRKKIYLINCHPVTPLKCHQDLGILLSHDLSWKQHYEFLSSKAYKILGLLRRTFSRDSSIHDKKILYLSLVKSKLTYCSPVCHPLFLKDVRSIENIQRRATKYNILNDYSLCYRTTFYH